MGIEYALRDKTVGDYILLGKAHRRSRYGYQMEDEVILRFLHARAGHLMVIQDDTGNELGDSENEICAWHQSKTACLEAIDLKT